MPSTERFGSFHEVWAPADKSSSGSLERAEVLNRLEQAVGEIHDSETFRRYLEVQARFHKYSWANVALILLQRPDATRVAGYNAWFKLHRYVKRGERGMRIIVPMHRKDKSTNEDREDVEKDRLFFGTGVVFDISQTDGEPLPEVQVPVLEGDRGGKLYNRLEQLAKGEGVSVRSSALDQLDGAMGVYMPGRREIIVAEAAQLQMTKTLAHELAHHFAFGDPVRDRAESESIAESVAYVVCNHFGLDTGARSFPYVALWAKDKAVLKQVLSEVQSVSSKMVERIEARLKDEEVF